MRASWASATWVRTVGQQEILMRIRSSNGNQFTKASFEIRISSLDSLESYRFPRRCTSIPWCLGRFERGGRSLQIEYHILLRSSPLSLERYR